MANKELISKEELEQEINSLIGETDLMVDQSMAESEDEEKSVLKKEVHALESDIRDIVKKFKILKDQGADIFMPSLQDVLAEHGISGSFEELNDTDKEIYAAILRSRKEQADNLIKIWQAKDSINEINEKIRVLRKEVDIKNNDELKKIIAEAGLEDKRLPSSQDEKELLDKLEERLAKLDIYRDGLEKYSRQIQDKMRGELSELKKEKAEPSKKGKKKEQKPAQYEKEKIKVSDVLRKMGYLDIDPKDIMEKFSFEDLKEIRIALKENKEDYLKDIIGIKIAEALGIEALPKEDEDKIGYAKIEEMKSSISDVLKQAIEAEARSQMMKFDKSKAMSAGKKLILNAGLALSTGIGVASVVGSGGLSAVFTGGALAAWKVFENSRLGKKLGGIKLWGKKKTAEQELEDIKDSVISSDFLSREKLSAIVSNQMRIVSSDKSIDDLKKLEQATYCGEKKEMEAALGDVRIEFFRNALRYVETDERYKGLGRVQQENMAMQIALTLGQHIRTETDKVSLSQSMKKEKGKVSRFIEKFSKIRAGRSDGSSSMGQKAKDAVGTVLLGAGFSCAIRSSGVGRVLAGAVSGAAGGYGLGEWLDARAEKKAFEEIEGMISRAEEKIRDVDFPIAEIESLSADANIIKAKKELGILDSNIMLLNRAENFIHNVRKLEMENTRYLKAASDKERDELARELKIKHFFLYRMAENNRDVERNMAEDVERLSKALKTRRAVSTIGGAVLGGLSGYISNEAKAWFHSSQAHPEGAAKASAVEEAAGHKAEVKGVSPEEAKTIVPEGTKTASAPAEPEIPPYEAERLEIIKNFETIGLTRRFPGLVEKLSEGGFSEDELKFLNDLSNLSEDFVKDHQGMIESFMQDGRVSPQEAKTLLLLDQNRIYDNMGARVEVEGDKTVMSFELGEGSTPKYLSQFFNRVAANAMKERLIGDDSSLDTIESAKALNVAANLRALTDGKSVAGIDPRELKGTLDFSGREIVIKDYEVFHEKIISKLIEHADRITENNATRYGAIAYTGNVKWDKIIEDLEYKPAEVKMDMGLVNKVRGILVDARMKNYGVDRIAERGSVSYNTEMRFDERDFSFRTEGEKVVVENGSVIRVGGERLDKEDIIELASGTGAEEIKTYINPLRNRPDWVHWNNFYLDNKEVPVELVKLGEGITAYDLTGNKTPDGVIFTDIEGGRVIYELDRHVPLRPQIENIVTTRNNLESNLEFVRDPRNNLLRNPNITNESIYNGARRFSIDLAEPEVKADFALVSAKIDGRFDLIRSDEDVRIVNSLGSPTGSVPQALEVSDLMGDISTEDKINIAKIVSSDADYKEAARRLIGEDFSHTGMSQSGKVLEFENNAGVKVVIDASKIGDKKIDVLYGDKAYSYPLDREYMNKLPDYIEDIKGGSEAKAGSAAEDFPPMSNEEYNSLSAVLESPDAGASEKADALMRMVSGTKEGVAMENGIEVWRQANKLVCAYPDGKEVAIPFNRSNIEKELPTLLGK